MYSRNLTFLILSLIALSQTSIISITPQASTVTPVTVSTYIFKTKLELDTLKKNPDFQALVARIRKFWENSMSEILGEIIAVEQQVASGINRRITFKVKIGFTIKKVLITVNLRPWASIMRVIATVPTIPGGIAESDLTKILSTSISIAPATVSLTQSRDLIRGVSSTTSTTTSSTNLRSEPVLISATTRTSTTVPRI